MPLTGVFTGLPSNASCLARARVKGQASPGGWQCQA